MKVLYIYDFRFDKEQRALNRARRLFYYHLGRIFGGKIVRASRSAVLVDKKYEKQMDGLLSRFRSFLLVYKVGVNKLKKLK